MASPSALEIRLDETTRQLEEAKAYVQICKRMVDAEEKVKKQAEELEGLKWKLDGMVVELAQAKLDEARLQHRVNTDAGVSQKLADATLAAAYSKKAAEQAQAEAEKLRADLAAAQAEAQKLREELATAQQGEAQAELRQELAAAQAEAKQLRLDMAELEEAAKADRAGLKDALRSLAELQQPMPESLKRLATVPGGGAGEEAVAGAGAEGMPTKRGRVG